MINQILVDNEKRPRVGEDPVQFYTNPSVGMREYCKKYHSSYGWQISYFSQNCVDSFYNALA